MHACHHARHCGAEGLACRRHHRDGVSSNRSSCDSESVVLGRWLVEVVFFDGELKGAADRAMHRVEEMEEGEERAEGREEEEEEA